MRTLRLPVIAIATIAGFIGLLPGCTQVKDPWPERPGPKVLASFAPLHCFAINVAGDDASVLCVMSETGPHHFDPSPQHALALRKADAFFINGLDLDSTIARKLSKSSRNPRMKLIELAGAIPQSDLREGGCNCGHEHGDDDHGHSHGKDEHKHFDPHIWLGVPEAIKMVGRIRDTLKELDPEHAAGYEERAKAYVAKLEQLQSEGRELLAGKKERKLLAFHDSLFYFTRTFGLELADAIEASPGTEPDPQTLANLVKTCKEKGVRHIAVEPQYDSNTSAKTILRELKRKDIAAELVVVDTLETARGGEMGGDWYEKKMRENLKNLADALK